MTNIPEGAILQRDKRTYAIVPRTPLGLVTPEILESIARVGKKYKIPIIKITSGQRMALVGIEKDDVEKVWHDLGLDKGKATELCVHYVQACPGTTVCRFGLQDSIGLGMELEKLFLGVDLPAKVKMGVSGCPINCGEAYVRDVGLYGKRSGWTLIFGGNAASHPRMGDVVAEDLSGEQALELTKRCLAYYAENGNQKERTARFMERTGAEEFKRAVL